MEKSIADILSEIHADAAIYNIDDEGIHYCSDEDNDVDFDSIKINGVSLTIMDDGVVGMNYYIIIPENLKLKELRFEAGVNGQPIESDFIRKMQPIDRVTEESKDGKVNYLRYKMVCNVPSTHMAETVSCKLINKNTVYKRKKCL